MINPSIFREYDIRGIVGETLHEADAHRIGRAFAHAAVTPSLRTVCLARDGRLSSPALHEAMAQGLREGGAEVADLGLGPTPMLYFGAVTLQAAGGVMITGSHNPPTHNGFKFMLGTKPFYGADIQALRQACEKPAGVAQAGGMAARDLKADYIGALAQGYRPGRPLKAVWDAGNGATGEIVERLIMHLPGEHDALNTRIDGTFPAHHPDPTVPKNLEQLIDAVRAGKADIGLAFDGDGDRLGVVDDEGGILWGDQMLALLARDVLRDKPGAAIIADVKASAVLFEEVARLGGEPLMWKTGHSLIKAKMQETGAPLAGEMSGHVFFADRYYGFDDGIYAAVRMLSMLAGQGRKLSELKRELPVRLNTPEIRFPCPDERKFEVIREVADRLNRQGAKVAAIDGVRVSTADGWWLLRASNTQAMLVARCESADEAGLARLKAALAGQLEQSKVRLPSE